MALDDWDSANTCSIVHLNSMGGATRFTPPGVQISLLRRCLAYFHPCLFRGPLVSRALVRSPFRHLPLRPARAGPQRNVEAVLRAYLACEFANRRKVPLAASKARAAQPHAGPRKETSSCPLRLSPCACCSARLRSPRAILTRHPPPGPYPSLAPLPTHFLSLQELFVKAEHFGRGFAPAERTLFPEEVAVPQQPNFHDCGVFLIEYAERFIKDGPPEVVAYGQDWPYMFTTNWFHPSDVRTHPHPPFNLRCSRTTRNVHLASA